MNRNPLKQANERRRGYAVERDLDLEGLEAPRLRPRLGGSSPLPAADASAELFLIQLEDLTREERAGAGWCVRLGVPELVDVAPNPEGFDLHELVVELTLTTAGTAYTLEVNPFPGCTMHLVSEQLSARMRWESGAVVDVPPSALLRWQLSRGVCQSSGVRAYTVQAAASGVVPPFATSFALFSADADITEDIGLDFLTHPGASRVQQHYTRDDLLQCVGEFTALPPGASAWQWIEDAAEPLRLAFGYEAIRR